MTSTESQAYAPIAVYYDLMMMDRRPYTDFYGSILQAGQISLIDIGCGTGIITSALAHEMRELNPQRTVRVVGIDGSAEMLKVAEERDPTVEWLLGDLRNVPDCGPCDLAVSCYNTLQHVDAEGLAQAFRSSRKVLGRGAHLVFDMYKPNIDYISIARSNSLARSIVGSMGEALEIREDSAFDDVTGILHLTWRLVDSKAPNAPALAEHTLQPVATSTRIRRAGPYGSWFQDCQPLWRPRSISFRRGLKEAGHHL